MGNVFRPGPRVQYSQKVLRFDDDTLSTIAIDTPLDSSYGIGGTRWRQTNAAAYRRPASEAYYQRRPFAATGPDPVTGTITATQVDDVAAITGTFTDPPYGDGGIRQRVQQAAYRRPGSEGYYQRHLILPPVETYTGTIVTTQVDDVAAITGQADDVYTGADPTRARAQSSVYRRLASRFPFTRHPFNQVQDTTVVGSLAVTQDDDTAAITGTFTDPAFLGDGGIRAKQGAWRARVVSRAPFLRRIFDTPLQPVTGVVAATQDDDVAAITGTVSDPLPPGPQLRMQVTHAHRRRVRPLYCQRHYTIDVSDPIPPLPPLVPPFAAVITGYTTSTANTTRTRTTVTATSTSTVGTVPRTRTVNTTPQGVT